MKELINQHPDVSEAKEAKALLEKEREKERDLEKIRTAETERDKANAHVISSIRSTMNKLGYSSDEAMDFLDIPSDERDRYKREIEKSK